MEHQPGGDDRFRTMADALSRYLRGETDIRSAADEAGLPEWDFLEAAQSMPNPAVTGFQNDLEPFVRRR